jgi:asparagine synthase (glutamine-hydrolysing)
MCGFVGFHNQDNLPDDSLGAVRAMAEHLRPRGPDDGGEWINSNLRVALGFRRLSILDLSMLGHQPMVSSNGRYVLVMNGEIYNHHVLRAELEQKGCNFRGTADTEVLLEAISLWGLEPGLKRAVGMFALALVDVHERRLFLARDRIGEKPLYYGWCDRHFFFGSELRAFRSHPNFRPEIDRGALTLYLRYAYVPSPHCILKGFRKLLPGHILSMPLDQAADGAETIRPYWSLPKPGELAPFTGPPQECSDELAHLLKDAIRMQMLADVPVGAFLSGGIDSSTVVALMQKQAIARVKTFCIGFPDQEKNEAGFAEQIASHLGTDHTTWYCDDSALLELTGRVPQAYSEPFGDDAQLPTLALARVAREKVTVSLSGDGGDELFLGYGWYVKTLRRYAQIDKPWVRTGLRCAINSAGTLVRCMTDSPLKRRWQSKLRRACSHWTPGNLPIYHRYRMSMNKGPDLYLSQPEIAREFFHHEELAEMKPDATLLSYLDLHTYFSEGILVKVDRAAMSFSLETRMPLLDHRVVEFASRIPESIKRRDGVSKWPLRNILAASVPRRLTDRPKMGFCTPMDRWLRGPLRDWAEAQISEERLRREGFFEPAELRKLWDQHQAGKRERGWMLWGFLMFQAWHEAF